MIKVFFEIGCPEQCPGQRRQSMKIGMIGLGMMGRGIAGNLLKTGHDIVVHDLSQAAAQPFLDAGATWADTPRELAQGCDLLFTSLPKPSDVMGVFDGPDGFEAGLTDGKAWFDFSTNSVDVIRAIHARAAQKGAQVLDAPISGGPAGAASGKLAIWIGGDEAAFAQHQPVLDALADQVRYIGPIGAGTITKLAHNMASTAMKAVMGEVLTMGVKAGLDPLPLWQAMRSGAAGRMRGFDNIQRFMTGNVDTPSFALQLNQKDVNLALELGRQFDVPMRVCSMVGQDMHEAMARGWGGRDSQAVLVLQQERAGLKPFGITEEQVKAVLCE
jgi:3-hydroxyisobutyrate dehydrogenase|tara:strand:+ start:36812 stop:37798 length:987 start_codon:yes stop_codon:yes gene_type:complete